MSGRAIQSAAFLDRSGWGDAMRAHLAGDASNRCYERLSMPDKPATILMDAPRTMGEDVRPFMRVADHLRGLGLSTPKVRAADPDQGFLLLEDFGDGVFSRLIEQNPNQERPLYEAAVDVLLRLHKADVPAWAAIYDAATMAQYIAPAFEWYCTDPPGLNQTSHLTDELERLLQAHCDARPVLLLRDFHAENLIWLPERQGVARVGLLDFQDALAGHPAYDLMSLLADARRDVSPEIRTDMVARYVAATDSDPTEFALAASLQSAQRNLRILGIFARLARNNSKPAYLGLIPRVWANLMLDLSATGLTTLHGLVCAALPEPTPDYLARLDKI